MEALVAKECGTSAAPPRDSGASQTIQKTTPSPPTRDAALSKQDVLKLQMALARLGIKVGSTGVIDDATRQALIQFQREAGLPVTGDADQATVDALMKAANAAKEPKASPQSACAALADLQRFDFEREWRGAVARIASLQELHQDISRLRDELKSDQFIQAGQWHEATAILLSTSKISLDLVVNIWEAASPAGAAARGVEKWGKRFVHAVKGVEWSLIFLRKQLDQLALEVLLEVGSSRNPLITATKAVYEFAKGMSELAEIPKNFSSLRNEMSQRIDNLDGQLKTIQKKIAANTTWMQMRSEMLAAAQQACSDEKAATEIPRLP